MARRGEATREVTAPAEAVWQALWRWVVSANVA